jgi:hypothetical protein
MSANIAQVALGPIAATASVPVKAASSSPVQSATVAVSLDTLPISPPPEIWQEIQVASEAADKLAASGRSLSFNVDPSTGRLLAAIHDSSGRVRTLSPTMVLRLAAGESIE